MYFSAKLQATGHSFSQPGVSFSGGGGGGSRVTCLNFKMSRVGVLSVLYVAVGNLMKIVCPCRNLRLVTLALRTLPGDEPALTPEFRENLLS